MKKLKAICWLLLYPLFAILNVIIVLAEHNWHWSDHLANVRCYWYGGAYVDAKGRVFDSENQQIYPTPTRA